MLGLALGALASGCARGGGDAGGGGQTTGASGSGPPQGSPPVPVRVARAEQRAVPLQLRANGVVEPTSVVAVRAQVGGPLVAVEFREGQDVSEGQVLFRIDPRPYEAALAQARGSLARDQALARDAEATAKRYQGLAGKEYITRQEYDRAVAQASAQRAVVASDLAAVKNAEINLGYATIRSPIAGRTGAVLVQLGNVVAPNGPPLVNIAEVKPIKVSFTVPEASLASIRQRAGGGGQGAKVVVEPPGAGPHEGKLVFIDNAVDRNTGTILLKAELPNEDETLWPGAYVNVTLTYGERAGAVLVPASAVQRSQRGDFVFVVKDDQTAESRPVKVAGGFERWSILDEGVQPGETVVTDGQLRLRPGAKVDVASAPEGAPAPEARS